MLEKRQGMKVACPEEIAYRAGFIDTARLEKLASKLSRSSYGAYLLQILRERKVLHTDRSTERRANGSGRPTFRTCDYRATPIVCPSCRSLRCEI